MFRTKASPDPLSAAAPRPGGRRLAVCGMKRTMVPGAGPHRHPSRPIDRRARSRSPTRTASAAPTADFRGRYRADLFRLQLLSRCLPHHPGVMAEALDKLGAPARAIVPIFITIDPERDTPKVLEDYMAAFGPHFRRPDRQRTPRSRRWKKNIASMPQSSRCEGGSYGMDHSSVIYLMGPDGKLVSFYDEAISPDDLAKDLKQRQYERCQQRL